MCRNAIGDVLEVAIGAGRNLPFYPPHVRLTGIEFSPAMLEIARQHAASLGRPVDLREGDAQALDLPDAGSTRSFALCRYAQSQTNVALSPR